MSKKDKLSEIRYNLTNAIRFLERLISKLSSTKDMCREYRDILSQLEYWVSTVELCRELSITYDDIESRMSLKENLNKICDEMLTYDYTDKFNYPLLDLENAAGYCWVVRDLL